MRSARGAGGAREVHSRIDRWYTRVSELDLFDHLPRAAAASLPSWLWPPSSEGFGRRRAGRKLPRRARPRGRRSGVCCRACSANGRVCQRCAPCGSDIARGNFQVPRRGSSVDGGGCDQDVSLCRYSEAGRLVAALPRLARCWRGGDGNTGVRRLYWESMGEAALLDEAELSRASSPSRAAGEAGPATPAPQDTQVALALSGRAGVVQRRR